MLGGEVPHVDAMVDDVKHHFLHFVVDRVRQLLAWSSNRLLDFLALHGSDDLNSARLNKSEEDVHRQGSKRFCIVSVLHAHRQSRLGC